MAKVTVPESFAVIAETMLKQTKANLQEQCARIASLEDTFGEITFHCHQPKKVDEKEMTTAFATLCKIRKALMDAVYMLTEVEKGGD